MSLITDFIFSTYYLTEDIVDNSVRVSAELYCKDDETKYRNLNLILEQNSSHLIFPTFSIFAPGSWYNWILITSG